MVTITINGVRVAKGTGYKPSIKNNNDKTDTFDGPDITKDEFPEYTVGIDRIDTYNSQYERLFDKAINGDNIPIVIEDNNKVDTYTGCYLESDSGDRAPKKKLTQSLSFMASKRIRAWK
jgi:hypothetical protein